MSFCAIHTASRPDHRAFTIVELLTVVAVVAIVAAIVIPAAGGTESTRLTAAAQMLVADIEYAQAESIANADDPRLIVFDVDTETYFIAADSDDDTPVTHPLTRGPFSVTLGQGVARNLSGVGIGAVDVGDDTALAFGKYGQLDQATDASVTLVAGAKSIVLGIDATSGEVTVGEIQ